MSALLDLLDLPAAEQVSRGLLHTPREIAQQPETWKSTFQIFQQRQAESISFLRKAGVADSASEAPAVYLLGAGTSDYIGKSLAPLLRQQWRCEVNAIPTTDLLTHFENLIIPDRRYLWISFSRSGESPESVAVLDRALSTQPGIHHVVVTCNPNGRMVRESAGKETVLAICLDDAVNDRGLAMTSSFSNMVILGHCLAHAGDLATYHAILEELIAGGKSLSGMAAQYANDLVKQGFSKACFVGSGPLRAVASEAALKVLELTAGKTLTLSESTLGLRHGPMAALDEDTLFVSFLSADSRVRKYEIDLLNEIGQKRLVRNRAVVANEGSIDAKSSCEYLLAPSAPMAVDDAYRPPVDVIFGQLLGLFSSLRWGLQPDCPSPNGAISRVVQNVSIYQ